MTNSPTSANLASLVRPELIFSDLPGPDRQGVLRGIAERFAAAGIIDEADHLYLKLLEREELGSTWVVPGVAIPHCKLDGLTEVVVSIGICPGGVDFGAEDNQPVKLFFTLISPADNPAAHLQSLALVSRWINADDHVEKLLGLEDSEAMLELLQSSEPSEGKA